MAGVRGDTPRCCTPITPQTTTSAGACCPGGHHGRLLLTRVGFLPPQYMGSFTVEELDLQQQAGQVEEQLQALKVGIDPLLPSLGNTGDPK